MSEQCRAEGGRWHTDRPGCRPRSGSASVAVVATRMSDVDLLYVMAPGRSLGFSITGWRTNSLRTSVVESISSRSAPFTGCCVTTCLRRLGRCMRRDAVSLAEIVNAVANPRPHRGIVRGRDRSCPPDSLDGKSNSRSDAAVSQFLLQLDGSRNQRANGSLACRRSTYRHQVRWQRRSTVPHRDLHRSTALTISP